MKCITVLAVAAMMVFTVPAYSGVSSVAQNAASKVTGALDKADQKASETLHGSIFEKIFSSVFGLTYLGDEFKSLCSSVDGEWQDNPAECKVKQ